MPAVGPAGPASDTAYDAAVDELRASEDRYKTLVEQASDGIFVSDDTERIIEVNESGAEMLGYARGELIGMALGDLVGPNHHVDTTVRGDALRHREIVLLERSLVRKDGSRLPVEISSRMTTDGRLQSIVRDVSERAEALAQLRASEALLVQSQRAAGIGHYVFDISGGCWSSYEVLNELLGIDSDYERTFEGWVSIVHPDDRAEMVNYLQEHILHDPQPFDIEYRIQRVNDKQTRWVRGIGQLEYDAERAPSKMFGVIQDITKRKLQELEILQFHAQLEQLVADRTAQLEAANHELEAFSYSVSHDLRAPLRHMSGFVELLSERDRDRLDEKGLHYLDVIADSVRQMGTLIDDLLQFSRVGRAEMKFTDVDMAALCEEARAPLTEERSGRAIVWEIGGLPHVRGDLASLKLVWANLLGNAVKYTKTRDVAHIQVGSRESPEGTEFFVRDDGVGFDMAYAGKLFGVFQRLHSAEDFEGTGIGLANVSRVVSRHGGRVWADATVDGGATFSFVIPRGRSRT